MNGWVDMCPMKPGHAHFLTDSDWTLIQINLSTWCAFSLMFAIPFANRVSPPNGRTDDEHVASSLTDAARSPCVHLSQLNTTPGAMVHRRCPWSVTTFSWSSWIATVLVMQMIIVMGTLPAIRGQCPWPKTPLHASLHADCVCGYSNVRRLSVQCSPVANFSQLLAILNSPFVQRLPIDLLYINNATGLRSLTSYSFKNLDILQIHIANTKLDHVESGVFAGLENKLLSLTLQNVGLTEIPLNEIRTLRSLRTLDLSNNRIKHVKSASFRELTQLSTLRLAFNPDLMLDKDAFFGIERSLKNLNLKGNNLKNVPETIKDLTELAFLDLAQNQIREIEPKVFERLHSLTALSLERNLIKKLSAYTFYGLNDSLSSLSLLNNLLVELPQAALADLTGLRVWPLFWK